MKQTPHSHEHEQHARAHPYVKAEPRSAVPTGPTGVTSSCTPRQAAISTERDAFTGRVINWSIDGRWRGDGRHVYEIDATQLDIWLADGKRVRPPTDYREQYPVDERVTGRIAAALGVRRPKPRR